MAELEDPPLCAGIVVGGTLSPENSDFGHEERPELRSEPVDPKFS